MAYAASNDDVFRFVIVRAPTPLPEEPGRAPPVISSTPPPIAGTLAGTLAELSANVHTIEERVAFQARRRELATAFVDSAQYVGSTEILPSGAQATASASSIVNAASHDAETGDRNLARLNAAISAAFGDAADRGFDARLIGRAWDSLLALNIVSGDLGSERARVSLLIRAQRVVEALAGAPNAAAALAAIGRVVKAPIALPRDAFFPGTARPWREPAPLVPAVSPAERLREQQVQLNREVHVRSAARETAIAELLTLLRRVADTSAPSGPEGLPASRSPVAGWRLQRSERLSLRRAPTAAVGHAFVDAGASISAETRRVLADHDLELGRDSIARMVEMLRAANAREVAQLAHDDPRLAQRPFAHGRARPGAALAYGNPFTAPVFAPAPGAPTAHAVVSSNTNYVAINPFGGAGFMPGVGSQPPASGSTSQPWLRPLGIGDLKVVRQTLLKYETGEIAYIENVLRSEERTREHRVLNTTETTEIQETEQIDENETTFEKTERYELQRETERTIESDLSLKAGVTVSGGFGPVEVTASTDFSYSQSSAESQRAAETYARSITDRSVERIKKRVRQERRVVRRLEVEEKNTHRFNNAAGANIAGIYYYVDKFYLGQVFNYGKRLMFELMVPDPAAFFVWRQQRRALLEESEIPPPADPGFLGPEDITRSWYTYYVKLYRVTGVEPPPPDIMMVGRATHQKEETNPIVTSSNELAIPDGYVAVRAVHVHTAFAPQDDVEFADVAVFVADRDVTNYGSFRISDVTKTLPIAMGSVQTVAQMHSIVVECECTPERFRKWQLETYEKIIQTYQQQLAEYRDREAARAASDALLGEYRQQTRHPLKNRQIEREELKRGCLTLIAQNNEPQVTDVVAPNQQIEGWIDVARALQAGPIVQFFEQAFDWDNMTYLFFPYFWSPRAEWAARAELSDGDTVFEQFLRAGWARVILPVTRQYEKAVLGFLGTGNVSTGDVPIVVQDREFLAYLAELEDADDLQDNPMPEGDPFEIKLPTDLIYLSDNAQLPDHSAELLPG